MGIETFRRMNGRFVGDDVQVKLPRAFNRYGKGRPNVLNSSGRIAKMRPGTIGLVLVLPTK